MPTANIVVTRNSNECDFIKAFVNAVKSNVSNVVCNKTDAEIESMFSDTGNTPSFAFTFDGAAVVTFTRTAVLSTSVTNYAVALSFNGTVFPTGGTGYWEYLNMINTGIGVGYDAVVQRRWKFQVFQNANILSLTFGRSDDNFPLPVSRFENYYDRTLTYQLFQYKDADFSCVGYHIGTDLICSDGTVANVYDRLQYVNNNTDPTDVEIIQNKILVANGTSDKKKTLSNIYDSSFNNAVLYPVDVSGVQHAYLTNYTLMPIPNQGA